VFPPRDFKSQWVEKSQQTATDKCNKNRVLAVFACCGLSLVLAIFCQLVEREWNVSGT
jgi:hypothetical protein